MSGESCVLCRDEHHPPKRPHICGMLEPRDLGFCNPAGLTHFGLSVQIRLNDLIDSGEVHPIMSARTKEAQCSSDIDIFYGEFGEGFNSVIACTLHAAVGACDCQIAAHSGARSYRFGKKKFCASSIWFFSSRSSHSDVLPILYLYGNAIEHIYDFDASNGPFLVATSGADVIRNLTSSRKSYLKGGGSRHSCVLATVKS
jgi:hypothetical protein